MAYKPNRNPVWMLEPAHTSSSIEGISLYDIFSKVSLGRSLFTVVQLLFGLKRYTRDVVDEEENTPFSENTCTQIDQSKGNYLGLLMDFGVGNSYASQQFERPHQKQYDRDEFLKTCSCWKIYFQRSFSTLTVLFNQLSSQLWNTYRGK